MCTGCECSVRLRGQQLVSELSAFGGDAVTKWPEVNRARENSSSIGIRARTRFLRYSLSDLSEPYVEN